MKALDTNVLVRFLVNDDPAQAAKVKMFLQKAERNKQQCLVATPVVLELLWVLSSVYDIDREGILAALEELLLMPVIEFEHPLRIRRLVTIGKTSPTDLPDLLIGICGSDMNADATLTFDKAAAKSDLFQNMAK